MTKKEIKGVIFDLDGVLLDTEKIYDLFWREAIKIHGYQLKEKESLFLRSLTSSLAKPWLKEKFGEDFSYEEIRETRIKLMEEFINHYGVEKKEGAEEVASFLKENNIPYLIATASPKERARKYLTLAGISEYFEKIMSAHQVKRGKPYPDVYLEASKQLGLAPQNCLAIEDSPNGILSAYRAGCLPIMVPDLSKPDEETQKLLYGEVKNLKEILTLLTVC